MSESAIRLLKKQLESEELIKSAMKLRSMKSPTSKAKQVTAETLSSFGNDPKD